MTISVDTNVLVRLFINENRAQSVLAQKCLETYDSVQIADTAIIETTYVLSDRYQLGRKKTCRYIKELLLHPKISCNRKLFNKALYLYENHPALSIEDCCLAVYAELNNAIPLLTFDQKLAKQLQHAELLT